MLPDFIQLILRECLSVSILAHHDGCRSGVSCRILHSGAIMFHNAVSE